MPKAQPKCIGIFNHPLAELSNQISKDMFTAISFPISSWDWYPQESCQPSPLQPPGKCQSLVWSLGWKASLLRSQLHPYQWDCSILFKTKISTVPNGFLPILKDPLPQIRLAPDSFHVLQKSSRKQHRKVRRSCWNFESALRAVHHSARPLERRSGSLTCSKQVGCYVNFHLSLCNIPFTYEISWSAQET